MVACKQDKAKMAKHPPKRAMAGGKAYASKDTVAKHRQVAN